MVGLWGRMKAHIAEWLLPDGGEPAMPVFLFGATTCQNLGGYPGV
jgi:hypothetical protein